MRIITRTIWILSIVSLLADVASELLYPVIPVYLREIGFSVFWIGVLEGIAGFTAGVSKGYFGKLSDEKGLRLPFIKLGYLLSAVSKPMMGMFVYPLWIFFARAIDRLGKGVRTAARDALLSGEATRETKARVFGFHRGMDTAGATIGPALALLYLYYRPGDYRPVFYLAFIPGILSVLCIFLLKEKRQPVSTLGRGNFLSFFKYYRIASPAYRGLVKGLLLFALFNSSDIFLLLKTKEVTGNDTVTIAAYVFYNLVYALTSWPMGKLADKIGTRQVFLAGLYGGFAFQPSVFAIFALFFLYGIYAAATEGIIKAWITNIAHDRDTATAVGFYTSCESICAFMASLVAGLVWTSFGSTYTFLMTAVVAGVVFIYFSLTTSRY
jgi:MFS family permease